MMSDAARRHLELEGRLISGRRYGTLSEELEDQFLDEMEVLWWKMSVQEREAANQRAAKYASQVREAVVQGAGSLVATITKTEIHPRDYQVLTGSSDLTILRSIASETLSWRCEGWITQDHEEIEWYCENEDHHKHSTSGGLGIPAEVRFA